MVTEAFKLKGRLYTFTVIQLLQPDMTLFEKQLDEVLMRAPKLLEGAPVVLDLTLLQTDTLEFTEILRLLHTKNLFLVGVQGNHAPLAALAHSQGMPVLHASATQDRPVEELQATPGLENKTQLHTLPVRSGQQIVNREGDLIITGSVGHGAELLASGNIHVYGTLRGRALAGIAGDKQARIFCHALEAELVAIAGFYLVSDAIEPSSKRCQIYLSDDYIHIGHLC